MSGEKIEQFQVHDSPRPAAAHHPSASGSVQLKARGLGHGFAEQEAALRPESETDVVQRRAEEGIAGAGGTMPYLDTIQKCFGGYDVQNVQAHQGSEARAAAGDIGARAYATGDHVAFGESPSLHTAAHEAAHVVQQRAGVQLKGGVGQSGDAYEQHADEVADAVVAGQDAQPILARMAPSGGAATGVQRKAVQRDAEPTYTHEPSQMPGQRAGQSIDQRAAEMGAELNADMARGVAGAADWDQEMALLRDNVDATYAAAEAGFRAFALGLYEAHENQELILASVARRQAQTAALVSAVVGVGLAFVSGGIGGIAVGAVTSVVGRFASLGATQREFIVQGFIDALKQGVNASGGAALQFNPSTPAGYGASNVRAFRDHGLAAIATERADAARGIAWLTNHQAELRGSYSPKALVDRNRQAWSSLQAGFSALGAGTDTRTIERNLWQRWVGEHGRAVRIIDGYSGRRETTSFDVPKEVLEHLQERLGVNESTVRRWAGM